MPFELDESLYILTGKMIINGRLSPLDVDYKNPFTWVFGSPLVPILYGIFYTIGGYYFVRILSFLFVFSSLILIYKLTNKIFDKKSAKVTLILAGISVTTVYLASDAILDSIAIFFFILAIYQIYGRNFFLSGISLSLSILCKFFVIVPAIFLIFYLIKKRVKVFPFLIGPFIILSLFSLLYYNILLKLFEFYQTQPNLISEVINLIVLSMFFIYLLPISFFIVILNFKEKFIKKHFILFIPFLVVIVFHILTFNFMSLHHHMAYGLIPLSILAGKILLKYKKMALLLLVIIVLNLSMLIDVILTVPSYTPIINNIRNMQGTILSYNPNLIHLIKGTDLKDNYVHNFFYFDYDNDGKSSKEDYREAMIERYFNYIIIPSDFTWTIKVKEIAPMIMYYYCTNSSYKGFQNRAIIFTPC